MFLGDKKPHRFGIVLIDGIQRALAGLLDYGASAGLSELEDRKRACQRCWQLRVIDAGIERG